MIDGNYLAKCLIRVRSRRRVLKLGNLSEKVSPAAIFALRVVDAMYSQSSSSSFSALLAYDHGAALRPNPNLVNTTGIDVNAVARQIGRLAWAGVLGVGDGELAVDNQMGRQAIMAVRTVYALLRIHKRSVSQPRLSPILSIST